MFKFKSKYVSTMSQPVFLFFSAYRKDRKCIIQNIYIVLYFTIFERTIEMTQFKKNYTIQQTTKENVMLQK